jgi:hypothetical protein
MEKEMRLVWLRIPKKLYALYREGTVFLGAFPSRKVAEQMKADLLYKDTKRPRRRILISEYTR